MSARRPLSRQGGARLPTLSASLSRNARNEACMTFSTAIQIVAAHVSLLQAVNHHYLQTTSHLRLGDPRSSRSSPVVACPDLIFLFQQLSSASITQLYIYPFDPQARCHTVTTLALTDVVFHRACKPSVFFACFPRLESLRVDRVAASEAAESDDIHIPPTVRYLSLSASESPAVLHRVDVAIMSHLSLHPTDQPVLSTLEITDVGDSTVASVLPLLDVFMDQVRYLHITVDLDSPEARFLLLDHSCLDSIVYVDIEDA